VEAKEAIDDKITRPSAPWSSSMKLLWTAFLIIASFFVTATLLTYIELAYYASSGFAEIDRGTPMKPLLLSGFSLLGIISKRLFDAASQRTKGNTLSLLNEALSPLSLIRSIVICPIVIISFDQSLQQISDMTLIGLIAYQNGFFFETVLQSREKKAADGS
jgi:hypothetical protein